MKCDISKYFDSIDHEILKRIIRKKIGSRGLLWLIDLIIDSYGKGVGIPIGNLTSQLFANIYLNELDHFIKDRLGISYYIRYMDDFVILDTDKERLFELRSLIKEFLGTNLKLKLHSKKSEYFPVIRGIDFLGYVVFRNYILLRKSTATRYVRKLRKRLKKLDKLDVLGEIKISFLHWYSYYHHAKCFRLICRVYGGLVDKFR